MEILIAITIGILVAAGLYRLLGGGKVDLIIGLILLSQAANLIILASGGFKANAPPLISKTYTEANLSELADPLPQALVLTAIVIGFGILAFLLTLLIRFSK